MLIRSLTLTLLLAIAGPLFAADNDSPIAGDMGRARPLIVIAQSTVDPVWVGLKKSKFCMVGLFLVGVWGHRAGHARVRTLRRGLERHDRP